MPQTITRRDALRGGLMLAASAAAPKTFAQTAESNRNLPPSPIRLGVCSYSLRKLDTAHVIDAMKQLRTPYLNVKDMHLPMTPLDQVREHADQLRTAGLKLTAAGNISLNKDDNDDIRAKFEYLKLAGIPLMVGAPTHQALPRVEKFVKQYNIPLAIHNHGPEDKEFPSPLDVLAAIKNMDPRIGCCVDVGHTMRAGTDPVEAIRRAGPRLFDIHMKDLAQPDVKESQVAVGQGIMPVRAIFQQLITQGYKGYVDLEYEIKPEDPLPGMIESFAYMRGVLTGMGYSAVATS